MDNDRVFGILAFLHIFSPFFLGVGSKCKTSIKAEAFQPIKYLKFSKIKIFPLPQLAGGVKPP
jgi:hypothetical protein